MGDKLQAQYQAGECRLLLKKVQDELADYAEIRRTDLELFHREFASVEGELRALVKPLEEAIKFWDDRAEKTLMHDDAVAFLQKIWDSGEMQGLFGYVNIYRTESRFDAERAIMAVRSLPGCRYDKQSWGDGFYALLLFLTQDLIVLIEGLPVEMEEPENLSDRTMNSSR